MGIFAIKQIWKHSHYKKSITQTAAKVKSFPILMGANFQESKKGFGGEQWSGRTRRERSQVLPRNEIKSKILYF